MKTKNIFFRLQYLQSDLPQTNLIGTYLVRTRNKEKWRHGLLYSNALWNLPISVNSKPIIVVSIFRRFPVALQFHLHCESMTSLRFDDVTRRFDVRGSDMCRISITRGAQLLRRKSRPSGPAWLKSVPRKTVGKLDSTKTVSFDYSKRFFLTKCRQGREGGGEGWWLKWAFILLRTKVTDLVPVQILGTI
jgi:hypothetical protein